MWRGLRGGLGIGTTIRKVRRENASDYNMAGNDEGIYFWQFGRYPWLCSHCFNFDNARARWERLFFFALSISAYVSPSYSKIGSQPVMCKSALQYPYIINAIC